MCTIHYIYMYSSINTYWYTYMLMGRVNPLFMYRIYYSTMHIKMIY